MLDIEQCFEGGWSNNARNGWIGETVDVIISFPERVVVGQHVDDGALTGTRRRLVLCRLAGDKTTGKQRKKMSSEDGEIPASGERI